MDVFEFREEDEVTETGKKMVSKFSDQLAFRNHVSGATETLSKRITGNIDYNCSATGSFSHLETENNEHSSSPNHVMRFKFESPDQSTEIRSNIPKFGESDADKSMGGRSSSDNGYNSDASDGPSSDKYFSGLDVDEDSDGIIFYPDYVYYSGVQYLDYVVKFCKSSVEVSNRTSNGSENFLNVHLEIDDIVKIESQWSVQIEGGSINIHFISKDAAGEDTVSSASGIQEFSFFAIDSNWDKKQEAIESLNVRYKALWDFLLNTGMEKSSALCEQKADLMPPRSYFPDFNKPFEEVIYPKGDPDAVSISKRDVDLLRPDTFVNDTIIDFYIKYLKSKLNDEEKIKFHFFNSFFFRKLADMDKDPSSAQDGKAAFLRVRKWTRKVNFLEKDFIFIPVNYNYHWSLLVICYFGEVANYKDVDSGQLARAPCVLHMDSIKGSHAGLKDLMQCYLWEEWKERKKEACEDLYSTFKNLEFISLELPQQQNSYDCGLFLLHYVERFLEYVPTNLNIHKITSYSKFLCSDWFPPEEASLKRAQIEKLIDNLIDGHSEEGSCGGNDAHCPANGPKSTGDCETSLKLMGESIALARFNETSVRSEIGQGIEMTLLQDSSVSSTHCIRSPGLVLKDLFESGASETFSDTPWQEFEQKGCLNGIKRLDSVIEASAEAGECFSQTELLQPIFQHQDGVPTGANGFPCLPGDVASHPSDLVAPHNLDVSPTENNSHDAPDIEAVENAELERPKFVSSEVTDNLTLRGILNDAKPSNLVESHEENDSENMAVFYEAANELPVEHISSDDIQANVVKDGSRSDSEEQHALKRMPIIPSDSEEQRDPKRMRAP